MKKIIEIDLDSKYEYVNDYDDNKLNDRLYHYILESLEENDKDILLKVKFNYTVELSDKGVVEDRFKKSFSLKLDDINKKIKKQNIRDMLLLFLGFLFLGIYCYLENFNILLVAEFFMVISWVAFWEFAESLLFNRRKLIVDRKKYKNLLNAEYEIDE